MAKLLIPVRLDIDLDEYRAEYGQPELTMDEIRMRIQEDLFSALDAAPYRSSLKKIQTQ